MEITSFESLREEVDNQYFNQLKEFSRGEPITLFHGKDIYGHKLSMKRQYYFVGENGFGEALITEEKGAGLNCHNIVINPAYIQKVR